MEHINNATVLKTSLNLTIPDHFYIVLVTKRRKDNPDMKTDSSIVDRFYIYSEDDLTKLMPNIIKSCELHNARAYINPNPISARKVALETASLINKACMDEDYSFARVAFDRACGKVSCETSLNLKKVWVIDIDFKLSDSELRIEYFRLLRCILTVYEKYQKSNGSIICKFLPTPNGFHILINPLDVNKLLEVFQLPKWFIPSMIKTNPLTILYA